MHLLTAAAVLAYINYLLLYASILDRPRALLERIPIIGTAILIQCAVCTGSWIAALYWWTPPDFGLTGPETVAAIPLSAIILYTLILIVHATAAAEHYYLPEGTEDGDEA